MGDFVAAHTSPAEPIFIAGSEPQIYYYAQRKSAGPYIFVYPLLAPFPGVRERQRAALDDLHNSRPALILTVPVPTSLRVFSGTPPEFLDGVDRLLATDYEVVAVLAFKDGANGPLLTGADAVRYFHDHPIRFDSMPSDPMKRSGSVVIWRRRGATDG